MIVRPKSSRQDHGCCRSRSSDEGARAFGLEGSTVLLAHQWHLPDNRELQPLLVHLHHVVAAALGGWQHRRVDDLDAAWLSAVTTSHFSVQLAHSTVDGDVSEFLVHVVRVGAALVPKPDAVVLHLRWAAVVELVDGEQLTATLLSLVQLLHEIPETRLSQHNVLGEQAHSVDFWRWVFRSWRGAAHDLKLLHLRLQRRILHSLDHCCNTSYYLMQISFSSSPDNALSQ